MADTIPNIVIPADTVVDIYADAGVIAAGIVTGDPIDIKMVGEGEAKLYFGATLAAEPDDTDGFTPLYSKGTFISDFDDLGAFAWSRHGCTISVTKASRGVVTLSESATKKGCKFTQVQEFIVDIANPLYVLYELPPGEEVTVELLKRLFKTDTDGADMLVLWDYDVSTATKTPLASFNENNDFRSINDPAFEVSLLNPSTLSATTGVRTLTGAATIIDDGLIRESSFISASGVGSNTTGDVDPALGFRRYKNGTGYLFKVTTRGNDNKIAVGYTWTETGC